MKLMVKGKYLNKSISISHNNNNSYNGYKSENVKLRYTAFSSNSFIHTYVENNLNLFFKLFITLFV